MSKHPYYYDRVTMALDDLLRCRKYCDMMMRLPIGKPFSEERTVYESLFVAFVVAYGRIFTTSKTVDRQFNESVSNDFGHFKTNIIAKQSEGIQKLHQRIMVKRDTAIAHSDGSSRNYQHYNDSPLATGRNPYVPYAQDEMNTVKSLVDELISQVGDEQLRVAKVAFKNALFNDN